MKTLNDYKDCKLYDYDGEVIGVIGENTGFENFQVGDLVTTGDSILSKSIVVKLDNTYTIFGWAYDKLSKLKSKNKLKLYKKFNDVTVKEFNDLLKDKDLNFTLESPKIENIENLINGGNLSDDDLLKLKLLIDRKYKESIKLELMDSFGNYIKFIPNFDNSNEMPIIDTFNISIGNADKIEISPKHLDTINLTINQLSEMRDYLDSKIKYLEN